MVLTSSQVVVPLLRMLKLQLSFSHPGTGASRWKMIPECSTILEFEVSAEDRTNETIRKVLQILML